jgi:hypothetical protein
MFSGRLCTFVLSPAYSGSEISKKSAAIGLAMLLHCRFMEERSTHAEALSDRDVLDKLVVGVQDIASDVGKLKEQIGKLDNKVDKVDNKVDKVHNKMDSQIVEVKNDIGGLKNKIGELENKYMWIPATVAVFTVYLSQSFVTKSELLAVQGAISDKVGTTLPPKANIWSNGMAEGIKKGPNELINALRVAQSEITEALEKRVRRVYTMTLLTLPHKFKWPLLGALVVAAGWRWGTKTKPGAAHEEAGKSADK